MPSSHRHDPKATLEAIMPEDPITDSEVSEDIGAHRVMHPASLANLMPPWPPGISGNPSGLTKNGEIPRHHALREALHKRLDMDALAQRWIRLAMKGNSTALGAIIERLWPAADAKERPQVLEALRLELTSRGAALTMARTTIEPSLPSEIASPAAPGSTIDPIHERLVVQEKPSSEGSTESRPETGK